MPEGDARVFRRVFTQKPHGCTVSGRHHFRPQPQLRGEQLEPALHGLAEHDVIGFQDRCFPDELTAIERTAELWFKRKSVEAPASLL
jgi:hypothetical protein